MGIESIVYDDNDKHHHRRRHRHHHHAKHIIAEDLDICMHVKILMSLIKYNKKGEVENEWLKL